MRIELSSIKRDTKEICKIVKQRHSKLFGLENMILPYFKRDLCYLFITVIFNELVSKYFNFYV